MANEPKKYCPLNASTDEVLTCCQERCAWWDEDAQAYERSVPTPVTRYEVEQIISTYTNKVRNDLRAIKKMLKEGAENG